MVARVGSNRSCGYSSAKARPFRFDVGDPFRRRLSGPCHDEADKHLDDCERAHLRPEERGALHWNEEQAVGDRRERSCPALGDPDDQRAALAPHLRDSNRGLPRRRRRQADQGVIRAEVDEVVAEASGVASNQAE